MERSHGSRDDAVILRRYADVRQAEFARSVLEGNGVNAFLDVPYTSSMFPHYVLAIGGVALLVRAADMQRATDILENSDIEGELEG